MAVFRGNTVDDQTLRMDNLGRRVSRHARIIAVVLGRQAFDQQYAIEEVNLLNSQMMLRVQRFSILEPSDC